MSDFAMAVGRMRSMMHGAAPRALVRTLLALCLMTPCLMTSCLGVMGGLSVAHAQATGQLEYENQCAVCHGARGRGDGPLAKTLAHKASDLTILAANNNGVLPEQYIFDIVDGKKFVSAHVKREMPIWGNRLADQAIYFLGRNASKAEKRKFVERRIRQLISYIGTLQRK